MRILDFTSDCVFRNLNDPDVQVVHVQNRGALTLSGSAKTAPRSFRWRFPLEILQARRYDWIILPPTYVSWNLGNNLAGRVAKKILRRFMDYPRLAGFFRGLVFGRKARLAVVDYADACVPSDFALECIRPRHYFKINLPRGLDGATAGPGGTRMHFLPWVFADDLLEARVPETEGAREMDVFVAGNYHNEERIKQREAAEILAARGWNAVEQVEKSAVRFLSNLQNTKLCLVGQGIGYHSVRMLEASAAGAAPVTNRSARDIHHEFEHGVNCFLYDPGLPPAEIADFVESLLRDRDGIDRVARGARELVDTRNRASVLSKVVHGILLNDTEQNRPASR